jgi:leucyl aminopeptidase (aminopeptidase T)
MMKGARRLVENVTNIKEGENVVIVTDTNKVDIAEVISAAVFERGAEVVISVMTPRKFHTADLPKPVQAAIYAADVLFAPTTVSASSRIIQYANPKARGVSLAGWYPEQLSMGGLFADFDALKSIVDKATKLLDQTKIAHLTSKAGTDISVALKPGAVAGYGGIARDPGSFVTCPIVEAFGIVDIGNESTKGIIVVDGSICLDEFSPLKEKVTFTIEKGRIEKIEGGWYADRFSEYLMGINDPTVYNLVEFAFGMNPEAKTRGWFAEDEGAGGTNHFGIGGWEQPGTTGVHIDMVCLNTTCKLDGKLVQKDGKLLI